MILGIGIDVCGIGRMEDALARWGERFWERVLSEPERRSLAHRVDRATALAGRFAAKEAVVKAMAGAPGVGWHHLEVRGAPRMPPTMALHGPARALAERMGVRRVHLSITHDAGVAAAVAILEGDGESRSPTEVDDDGESRSPTEADEGGESRSPTEADEGGESRSSLDDEGKERS
ncbi:holo-ACP synthase [Sorangium atrum]|uniref:Holo-[acyl-carrier-protein] synthase n=1 Tax=Sorangium atrum TaxID=2995308 RepID=A0ABT5C5E7_9BACT|nr:holo-ACP synthase [Sorangium aterium]MDC0680392.1 holo-ACP synthase [Sorangium aterium]